MWRRITVDIVKHVGYLFSVYVLGENMIYTSALLDMKKKTRQRMTQSHTLLVTVDL